MSNKLKNRAKGIPPVAPSKFPLKELVVSATLPKFRELQNGIYALKDYPHTSMRTLRMFKFNIERMFDFIKKLEKPEEEINKKGRILQESIRDLRDKNAHPTEEMKAQVDAIEEELRTLHSIQHKLKLILVPKSEFPEDRSLYPEKTLYFGGRPQQVPLVSAYLSLYDMIIVDDEIIFNDEKLPS